MTLYEQNIESAARKYIEQILYDDALSSADELSHDGFIAGAEWERNRGKWISVKDRPLYTTDEKGNWVCTEDGDKEFIAAIPYEDARLPNRQWWWIRHCVVEDVIGLCVIGDDDNEPSGWTLEQVTHWQPLPEPPTQKP
ncbi:MAG: hypothetical protein ACREHG_10670 [Candidatus Saccharimonadales bacterium]